MIGMVNEEADRIQSIIEKYNKEGVIDTDANELSNLIPARNSLRGIVRKDAIRGIVGLEKVVYEVMGEEKGKELLAEGLEVSPRIFYECFQGYDREKNKSVWRKEEVDALKDFVREVAGDESDSILTSYILPSYSNMFEEAVRREDVSIIDYLVDSIQEMSAEHKDKANEGLRQFFLEGDSGLKEALTWEREGYNELSKVYLEIVRSICAPEEAKGFEKQVVSNVALRSSYYKFSDVTKIIGDKSSHPELRRSVLRAEVLEEDKDHMKGLIQAKGVAKNIAEGKYGELKLPDIDDIGEAGDFYVYGSMIDCMGKILTIADDVPVSYKKILSNHGRNNSSVVSGSDVNWLGLAKSMDGITQKDAIEAADTVREISNIVALQIIAANEPQAFDYEDDELESKIKPLAEQIHKYMVEEKSVPQLVGLSKRWHKIRFDVIKPSNDASTIRDFSREGAWSQVTYEKETNVTLKGFESYSIIELNTSQELDEEGIAMNHCASGYVDTCEEGTYHVFSVRNNRERVSTIGIESNSRPLRCHQNYGYGNEEVSEDVKIVGEWFAESLKGVFGHYMQGGHKVHVESTKTPLENKLGISRENSTPERLSANLKTIFEISRGKTYTFGYENKGADADQFLKNLQGAAEKNEAKKEQGGFAGKISKTDTISRQ